MNSPIGIAGQQRVRWRNCRQDWTSDLQRALAHSYRLALTALLMVPMVSTAAAQLPQARLNSIFPAGGRVGTEFDVTIGGIDLDDSREILFSHSGITARPKMTRPSAVRPEPQPLPNEFVIAIAVGTPLGIHEARVVGHYGVSDPRAFAVGQWREMNAPGGNNAPGNAMAVALQTTVNGRAEGIKAGFYRLELKLGQRVMLDLWAERIDSKMDATLSVCKANGETIITSRDQYGRDPFLDFTAPAEGVYLVKVFDFVFEGGSERFYRLSINSGPFVEYVFPPALLPGDSQKITLFGRNLPGGRLTENTISAGKRLEQLDVEVSAPDEMTSIVPRQFASVFRPISLDVRGFIYRYQTDRGASNPVWISCATAPVVREQEPNDHADRAQQVKVPCEVAGQFYARGDEDWIQFQARKGDVFWLDVFSHRLGLPTDPFLLVQRVNTDQAGNETVEEIAEADDTAGRPGGPIYDSPSNDPSYRLQADRDATYRVLIRDLYVNSVSSPRHVYRLSIRRPDPDFRLLVAPHSPWNPDPARPQRWNTILRRGAVATLRVLATRRDGFGGDISLSVTGLPAQVTVRPVTLRAGAAEALLVFEVAQDAPAWSGTVQVTGRATIGEAEVVRRAHGGMMVWDEVSARLTTDFALAVIEETAPVVLRMAEDKKWEVVRGSKISIPFQLDRLGDLREKLELQPLGLPGGVTAVVTIAEDANGGSLDLQVAGSAPPGDHSLFLEGKPKIAYRRNPGAARRMEAAGKQLSEQLAKLVAENKRAIEVLMQAEMAVRESDVAVESADRAKLEADQQLESSQQALATAQKEFESSGQGSDDDIAKAESRIVQTAKDIVKAIRQRDGARLAVAEARSRLQVAQARRVEAATAAAAAAEKLKVAEEISAKTAQRAKELTARANPKDVSMYVVSVPILLNIQETKK